MRNLTATRLSDGRLFRHASTQMGHSRPGEPPGLARHHGVSRLPEFSEPLTVQVGPLAREDPEVPTSHSGQECRTQPSSHCRAGYIIELQSARPSCTLTFLAGRQAGEDRHAIARPTHGHHHPPTVYSMSQTWIASVAITGGNQFSNLTSSVHWPLQYESRLVIVFEVCRIGRAPKYIA